MPIATSSDGTQRVAPTAAPHRAKLQVALGKFPEPRSNARSPAEVRNGSNPRHTVVYSKLSLEADLQIKCPIGMKFRASIPGSPQLQEAAKSRLKNGATGAPSTKALEYEPYARSTSRLPHRKSPPDVNVEEDDQHNATRATPTKNILLIHEEGLRRRSN